MRNREKRIVLGANDFFQLRSCLFGSNCYSTSLLLFFAILSLKTPVEPGTAEDLRKCVIWFIILKSSG